MQFYTHDRVLLDGLGASLGNALELGESVIAVMTKSHQKGFVKRLADRGIDITGVTGQGRLAMLEASETLYRFMDTDEPTVSAFCEKLEM